MTTPTAQRVAAEVRAEMARQHRSVRDLAAALDLSYSAASRRFNGEIALDMDDLHRVAAWLGLPPAALLAESALPQPRAAS